MKRLLLATILAISVSPANAEYFVFRDGANTAAAGCVAQGEKSADAIITEMSKTLREVTTIGSPGNVRTSSGEPIGYVTGLDREKKEISLQFSTRDGCIELLASSDAQKRFDRYQIMHEDEEYMSLVQDNLARLKAGKALYSVIGESLVTANGHIISYHAEKCPFERAPGRKAVLRIPGVRGNMMGCWTQHDNKVVIRWLSTSDGGLPGSIDLEQIVTVPPA